MKFAILLLFFAPAAFANGVIRLHPLINQNQVDGSGCSFWPARTDGKLDYFQWDFLADGWINLGASDVKLTLVKDSQVPYPQDQLPLGRGHSLTFSGSGIRVVLRTHVTWVCPGNDESCEAWHEAGEVQVTSGKRRFSSPIRGTCGS